MVLADINLLYSLSGFAVGMIVGFTGVGGGSLMTPVLVLLFGVHPSTAVGTDLLYAAVTKSFGAMIHNKAKSVDWQIVRRLALGSVPATLLTFLVMNHYDLHSSKGGALAFLLGCVLLATSATLLFRNQIVEFLVRFSAASEKTVALQTVITGAILGALVTTTSVGAGAIGVTALLVIYPRLPVLKIVGSDIAHAVPLTLISGLGHWYMGDVDFIMLASLLIGSVPGIMLGSHFAPRIPETALRIFLAVILVLVSLKLILS
jgi:uncharacterized membrane protein YfcA